MKTDRMIYVSLRSLLSLCLFTLCSTLFSLLNIFSLYALNNLILAGKNV